MNRRWLGLSNGLLLISFSVFNKSICLQLGNYFKEKRVCKEAEFGNMGPFFIKKRGE